jgi:peptidoglycan hydrolase CwlO-like protein
MTRSDRSFPVGPRLLALCVALAALVFSVPVAGAAPSATDVENAKQLVAQVQADLAAIEARVAAVQAELDAAIKKVDEEQTELDAIVAQIEATKARIERARERYEAIRAQLNERAAQAFM